MIQGGEKWPATSTPPVPLSASARKGIGFGTRRPSLRRGGNTVFTAGETKRSLPATVPRASEWQEFRAHFLLRPCGYGHVPCVSCSCPRAEVSGSNPHEDAHELCTAHMTCGCARRSSDLLAGSPVKPGYLSGNLPHRCEQTEKIKF
jgi:hypothetical protein